MDKYFEKRIRLISAAVFLFVSLVLFLFFLGESNASYKPIKIETKESIEKRVDTSHMIFSANRAKPVYKIIHPFQFDAKTKEYQDLEIKRRKKNAPKYLFGSLSTLILSFMLCPRLFFKRKEGE